MKNRFHRSWASARVVLYECRSIARSIAVKPRSEGEGKNKYILRRFIQTANSHLSSDLCCTTYTCTTCQYFPCGVRREHSQLECLGNPHSALVGRSVGRSVGRLVSRISLALGSSAVSFKIVRAIGNKAPTAALIYHSRVASH